MKKFTKKASLIAMLSALTTPVLAADLPTVYGKAHLSFGSVSEDDGITKTSSNAVSSHASRIGIKGNVVTDGDTKVVYKLEWQVDMADVSKDTTAVTTTTDAVTGNIATVSAKDHNHIKSRNMYVGLKGGWGEVRIGRDDSPYKLAGKKNVEHLSDTWADFNNIIDKGQDTRNDNSVAYWNKIGPGKLGLAYAAGADDPAKENAGENTSVAYDMKIDNFGFAVATQTIEKSLTNDETGVKVSLGYTIGNTQLGLMSEAVKDDGTLDDKNTYFSVKQKLSDTNSVVVAYGVKDQGLVNDATMMALSFNHKLGKKVSVYGLWADGADNGLNDASKLANNGSVLVAGVIAKF
ncbi:MAG: porin [Gammaproteobacteria bacterium]|nr:porin [Gammaproteobacteria bacterium]